MARETSVVTPERYSQGFDYIAYMNEIKVNKARFEGFYETSILTDEDVAALRELRDRERRPQEDAGAG